MAERILAILEIIARYYTLTRAMIQESCLPEAGRDGAIARKVLNQLRHDGLINQTRCLVANPHNGSAAPIYYPSRKGCELLAQEKRDDRWLRTCTQTPNWQMLHHWVGIAKFHVILDKAVATQNEAELLGFLHEWDVANPAETDPAKRFKLFTEIRKQPRLVFAPDAAFLLSYHGYKKVYYLEIDRQTSGVQQIAASKSPGVIGMAEVWSPSKSPSIAPGAAAARSPARKEMAFGDKSTRESDTALAPTWPRSDSWVRRWQSKLVMTSQKVRGPVIIGAGRYAGFGLCRPILTEKDT